MVNPNRTATLHVSGVSRGAERKDLRGLGDSGGTGSPRPAGLFRSGENTTVHLRGTVPKHAVVAVTVEPAGGSKQPTTTPIFSDRRR